MKTLNIKITVLETGEELVNEDTNAIVCGICDNDGNAGVLSNISGNLKAVMGALDSVNKAAYQTIKDNSILSRIGETFGEIFKESKSEVEKDA